VTELVTRPESALTAPERSRLGFQLFPELDAATEAALRASIERFGVLVPVAKDQHGRILDGFHRSRIADELGIKYRVDVHVVADDDEARELARTLNADRRQLSRKQRVEVEADLREQGHSLPAIAGALGVHHTTVMRDLTTCADAQVPDRITGLDGKSRPSKRTVVAAKNPREAERAQAALALATPTGVVDVKRAERIAREAEADRRRQLAVAATTTHGEAEIHHCDIRQLEVPEGSVDLIFTDPPYLGDTLDAYDAVADFAAHALRPGAALIAYCGNVHGFYCAERLARRLEWVTFAAVVMPGCASQVWKYKMRVRLKPLLVFSRGRFEPRGWWEQLITSPKPTKDLHPWQQSEGDSGALIEALTAPGDLVCDPFVGSGTTAVVALRLGRRFLGCDLDGRAVGIARSRLAELGSEAG
jgi:ParB-like chromosome segregation protein Spo0J